MLWYVLQFMKDPLAQFAGNEQVVGTFCRFFQSLLTHIL